MKILLACRVGTDDVRDADVAAALEEVRRVPELHEWWVAQQKFHASAQESFRSAPVPENLRDQLLARTKIIRVDWWRRPVSLGAAAAIVLLFVLAGVFFQRPRQDTFAVFRSRMVGNVLRQYSMSITTNDMAQVRQHLASRQAPADYELPSKLNELPVIGAGVLSWGDRRVSMVCLDSKRRGMLFLFIVDAASITAVPKQLEFAPVRSLQTVSWTNEGKTYVLAGSMEAKELAQFL